MNATKTGLTANIVGILGLLLGMFGIELDHESQAQLIGAAGIVGLIINQVIVAWAQRQQPAAPQSSAVPPKDDGFLRSPALGFALCVLSFVALLAVSGCATQTITPNKMIAAASLSIEQIALQIDQAQKSGQISNEREDKLLDELKQINADLRFAHQLSGPLQTQSLEAINTRLAEMRAQLAQEKTP